MQSGTSLRTSAVAVPCGDGAFSVAVVRSPARCTPLMHGGGGARILRSVVPNGGQDVRVEGQGVHVGIVPKKERYSLSLAQDAHPTPSPRLGAHLKDARSDLHLCILAG
jgi:hypothetical protein